MKISFIIASKNAEKTIEYTLRSFLRQTNDNFELIIVDNSTDETPEILGKYEGENIKIFHRDDKCASEARNIGMSYATGDYIVFFDADDEVHPCLVKNLTEVISKYEPEIIVWNYNKVFRYIGERLKEKFCDSNSIKDYFPLTGTYFLRKVYLEKSFWIWIGNICYKTSFLRKFNMKFPEEFIFGEDPNFSFKALSNSERCAYINKTLAYYVQAPGSLTRRYNKRFPDQLYAFIDMANYADQKFRDSGEEDFRRLSEALRTQWVLSAFVNSSYLNFVNLLRLHKSWREAEKIFFENLRKYSGLKKLLMYAIEYTSSGGVYVIYKKLARNIIEGMESNQIKLSDLATFMTLRKIGDLRSRLKFRR